MLDGREFDGRELEARALGEREFIGLALFCCTCVELFCERVTGARLALFCERAKVLLRCVVRDCATLFELRVLLFDRAKFELRLVLAATAP